MRAAGWSPTFVALIGPGIFVTMVLAWALFRRGGYKRRLLNAPPGAGWTPTGEEFLDPVSRDPVRVWYHPGSGERVYVRVQGSCE